MSKLDFKSLKDLKIISIQEADEGTFEAFYASICRWYSREFSTPLPQVEDMSVETVLKTYYDDAFWNLSQNKTELGQKNWQELILSMIQAELPPTEEEITEEEEDDDWYQKELEAINEANKASETLESENPEENPNLLNIENDSGIVEFEDSVPNFEDD